MTWNVRLAREEDIPALNELIPQSVRGLSAADYSTAQMDAALGSVFGVDRQLIRDGTYFVVEIGGESSGEAASGNFGGIAEERRGRAPSIVACGGWSKRRNLFGSDHHTNRDDAELDPGREPARIRAFFVHPNYARRGLGRIILDESEKAIGAAGFKKVELAATLPGAPFYAACGYLPGERSDVSLPNGLTLEIVRMNKSL